MQAVKLKLLHKTPTIWHVGSNFDYGNLHKLNHTLRSYRAFVYSVGSQTTPRRNSGAEVAIKADCKENATDDVQGFSLIGSEPHHAQVLC